METLKEFFKKLTEGVNKAIDEGDVFKANEITSNITLGSVILLMEILSVICLILNEVGIFTADKLTMRCAIATVVIIESPILALNQKYHGEASWLKGSLVWGLLAISGILSSTLGHNVNFVIVIPVILSLRYCDAKFTRIVVICTIAMLFLSTIANAYFGIINLNVYQVSSPVTVTIVDRIRTALDLTNIDHLNYLKKLIVNDTIPKLMVFSVIGFACIRISDKGKDLTDMQDRITKKTQRLETELNLATEIQASMLPCIFPAFPEHNELDLYAVNYPAKEVGGDFYDYFIIDKDHIAVVMADVSGKGVGAALFMTIAKIVLKNQLMSTLNPALALTITNKQLCENNDAELFVTCWAGIYEISSHTMTFANAGHNYPVIFKKNESACFLATKTDFVLAGFETSKYTNSKVILNEGDGIFLYTDGVTEANNIKIELFGDNRLISTVEKYRDKQSKKIVESAMNDLREFIGKADQFDDITIMSMRIKDRKFN